MLAEGEVAAMRHAAWCSRWAKRPELKSKSSDRLECHKLGPALLLFQLAID